MTDHCDLKGALLESYDQVGNPYNTALRLCAFAAASTFLVSSLGRNYSQVDKIWSLIPIAYAWIPVINTRTLVMAMLVTIWGIRLTWNFNRRGGYTWPPWQGDEDYRWAELQKLPILGNPIVWTLFNLGFISIYQNILLLLIVSPSFVAYSVANTCEDLPWSMWDSLATCLILAFIVIESIADNQQYQFQTEKYRRKRAGESLESDFADGFLQSGLFAVVRKPNYAAEQSIWISLYLFTAGAMGEIHWNWSVTGFISLCLLFQGSGWFTERITLKKYLKYKDYARRVPLYIPNPLRLFSAPVKREKRN